MFKQFGVFATLTVASLATAQSVQVSIGVRETGFGGSIVGNIGGNGGTVGGIEWVNIDGQTLVLDGTWQQFTFRLTSDPIQGFAGTSANSILEGSYGVLECVRVLNNNGRTDALTLHIDDVANTITPAGGSPTTTVFGDFEGYTQRTEVMFQEPPFSGSTAANVLATGLAGADNFVASRTASCRFDLQFVDNMPNRWVRLTTFNVPNLGNPVIRFDDQSVLTFWMRGGDCQENRGSQGPGNAYAELCGLGLNAAESSTYYVAGANAAAPGVVVLSFAGQPDLPIFGGNLVSGFGIIVGLSVQADASGRLTVPVPGSANVIDIMLQSAFIDFMLPQSFTFTNAVQARFGI
jgi:hypothetical protein